MMPMERRRKSIFHLFYLFYLFYFIYHLQVINELWLETMPNGIASKVYYYHF